jgi:hypothetical protein
MAVANVVTLPAEITVVYADGIKMFFSLKARKSRKGYKNLCEVMESVL